MSDALECHNGSVSIGGRIFINFRFAYYIVVNAEEEAHNIVTNIHTICTRYIYIFFNTRWGFWLPVFPILIMCMLETSK